MNKAQYERYIADVQRGLQGLEFVSTGACPGCPDCGLEPAWKIKAPSGTESYRMLRLEKIGRFFTKEEAETELAEIEKANPEISFLGCCIENESETENAIELASEPHFSWSACDCCGSRLGGDRHAAHGWLDHGGEHGKELIHLNVCSDCLYFINYGKLDDLTMMEMEASAD